MSSQNLSIKHQQFYLGDRPFRILSGAIHYFRVMPNAWPDRLAKLKACGFNTVETYVPWNLHEPKPGHFHYEGIANLFRFIEQAQEAGLWVIVRPSPYICSEWEFGGLPAWLLNIPGMRLRCMNQPYLSCVNRYYDDLLPRFKPYLSTSGGPIIAMQIENEYGSYGNDHTYLLYLKNSLIDHGIDVLLMTSDGPTDRMLQGGTLPDVLKTANFGSRAAESFTKLREYEKQGPLMCTEYWNGWFDHWGEQHHTRPADDAARVLDDMLKAGGSVNFYMFHGGTNFGFYNGANYADVYQPTVTSYDYDSLLDEAGHPTAKYKAVRKILAAYQEDPLPDVPVSAKAVSFGDLHFSEIAKLDRQLLRISEVVSSATPEPMEVFGQSYGFIFYETTVQTQEEKTTLHLPDMHDRALVFINDVYQGTVERRLNQESLEVKLPGGEVTIRILVENMGRVNYGPRLFDSKGLSGFVRLDYQHLFGWTIYPLPLDNLHHLLFSSFQGSVDAASQQTAEHDQVFADMPCFYRAFFEVDVPADTYVDCRLLEKGVVFINGFNLGRYWSIGPQRTLYLPSSLLKIGKNELVVFELHPKTGQSASLIDKPVLG